MVSIAVPSTPEHPSRTYGLTWVLAWRNLWRNRRRTWLTAGGIAFASLLVTMSMALQVGSYQSMIDSSTKFYLGHAQINHKNHELEEKLEQTVTGVTQLLQTLRATPGVKATARAQAFALASVGERSFGAAVVGVDFAAEAQVVDFFSRVTSGRLPVEADEVLVGEVMARNLGAGVGDELILLGTAKEGGIGALALRITGLYRSGQVELDRTLVFTHLATVQNGFDLGDEAHAIVLRFDDVEQARERAAELAPLLPPEAIIRPWQKLLPEVVQGIELDRVSAVIFYGVILVLVTFSVVNTFIMIVFERTKEFGMLLALGTKPSIIMRQVQAEAFMMWVVGTVVGLVLSNVIVGWAAAVGIPLGGFEEMAQQYYMPSRLYPAISLASVTLAPAFLLVGTQLAALLVTLRIRTLRPVDALRGE
jgi:putative ABC transport system permease protein